MTIGWLLITLITINPLSNQYKNIKVTSNITTLQLVRMECKDDHSWWSHVVIFRLWFYYQLDRVLIIKYGILIVIYLSSYLRDKSTHCRGILNIDLDQCLEHSSLLLHQPQLTDFNLHKKHPPLLFKLCQDVESYVPWIKSILLRLKLILSLIFFAWTYYKKANHAN